LQRVHASLAVAGHDHLLHHRQALFLEEHVLGAAQADALGAEAAGALGVARVVGVGPHAQAADLVGPLEQRAQVLLALEVGIVGGELTEEDLAGAAVDRDPLPLVHGDGALGALDRQSAAARR
jgi:hypothetical protein